MRCMIEDLSRVLQALQRQEHAEARMEIPVCGLRPFNLLEGSQKDEEENVEDENPFHDAGPHNGCEADWKIDWFVLWKTVQD